MELFLLYSAISLILLVYGCNCYVLTALYWTSRGRALEDQRERAAATVPDRAEWPVVTTQIPVYNERNVVLRVIDAVAGVRYPEGRHEVQILDDSDDDTADLIDRAAREWRRRGVDVRVIRRAGRAGYKAGALQYGLERARGEFTAVFDADFAPPEDFLEELIPEFLRDGDVGLVQARWGHFNRRKSLFTRAQAIGLDGHFVVEQAARAWSHLFFNFNGTAGIWRKSTIEAAGGWSADTLTEDMDLSYRAQLVGWKALYRPDVVVPAELPESIAAFKSQQFRWSKGAIQTARKLLPGLWRRPVGLWRKVHATLHLTRHAVYPILLFVALVSLPLMVFGPGDVGRGSELWLAAVLFAGTLAPALLYVVGQQSLYRDWPLRIGCVPLVLVLGVGVALSNSRAVFEGLFTRAGEFVRTPKQGMAERGCYRARTSVSPVVEIFFGVYCAAAFAAYANSGYWVIGPFLALYFSGFLFVGLSGLGECFGGPGERGAEL